MRLHVGVELVTVIFAHVVDFADPQHDALEVAIEAAKHLGRRYLSEVPWANSILDRLQHGVLADAGDAAKHQPVVDLFVRPLHAVGERMR